MPIDPGGRGAASGRLAASLRAWRHWPSCLDGSGSRGSPGRFRAVHETRAGSHFACDTHVANGWFHSRRGSQLHTVCQLLHGQHTVNPLHSRAHESFGGNPEALARAKCSGTEAIDAKSPCGRGIALNEFIQRDDRSAGIARTVRCGAQRRASPHEPGTASMARLVLVSLANRSITTSWRRP